MFFKRNRMNRLCAFCLLFFLVAFQHAWTAEAFDAALFTPRGDEFWTTFAFYTKAAADDIGLNLEVHNANENQQTMLDQIEAVCKKGTDAIIFMNYQGIGETILQIAEKYKTPAFLVTSAFEVQAFSPRGKYRYWIGELTADHYHTGALLAQRLAEIADGKGIKTLNIFAFQGVAKDVSSILRMDGLRNIVDAREEMRIIDTAAANWDREQARTIFCKALSEHPEINVVWGANDRMAQGAAEAVRELGIDRPMVFGGINWGMNALKALEQGFIDIDIGGLSFDGALSAIMVFDYLNGHDFADERLRFTSNMVAIIRQNIEKFNTILVRPELIDFRSLSKTHNPKLLQYNFNLNTIAEKIKAAPIVLTDEERVFLDAHPVIRTAIDRSWAPVEFLDEEGNFQGISADYINRLEEMLGVTFEIARDLSWQESMAAFKRGELDLFTSLRCTPERKGLFDFTDTYTSFPIAIFSGPEVPYIGSMQELNGRKVGVVEGYAIQELLATNHPDIELVVTSDTTEALEKLSRGEIHVYAGNILVTGYYIGKLAYTHIKVVGETPYRYEQSMGVRKDWPTLISILNKALDAVSTAERTNIYKRWISVRYEHGFDYSLLWKVIAGALAVLAIFFYWNRKLAGLIRQLLVSRSEAESARDEAKTACREAEAANLAKRDFLANMSHELRTPLNAILGFSQLMERDPDVTGSQQENLATISRSGEHLLALINDVLDMSKIDAGRTALNIESFDLLRTLAVIEEMIRSRAGTKGLQFTVARASDVPRYIRADEPKLRQVLLNLLGNAVKFTKKGSVTLQVASHKPQVMGEEGSAQYPVTSIRFQISDTGPGIAAEEIEAIFNPFVQKPSDQTSSEGTGLGLAISRKFVQMMGGEIFVVSEVDKGSTFKFDIRVEVSDMTRIEPEKPSPRVIGLAPGQPAYCILVVEDNKENRALLCKLLQSVGLEVQEAVNGKEAIKQYEKRMPDLIWMDMRMPVMDGLEATKRIRKLGTRTPIIALTAHAFEEEKEKILTAGCDDFVRKPFQEAEIFDAMARHLGVRYIYEEGKGHKDRGKAESLRDALTPKALAQLPDDLLADLKQAIIDLDVELIQAVIGRIRKLDSTVADGLIELAEDFQYDKILALI